MRQLTIHRGLVLLAGLILCLHTVFPHVHGPDGDVVATVVAKEKPAEDRTFLDVLFELVTADLGEEHLEHFTQSDGNAVVVVLALPPAVTPPEQTFLSADQQVGNQIIFQPLIAYHPLLPEEEALVRQRPLRGPPFVG